MNYQRLKLKIIVFYLTTALLYLQLLFPLSGLFAAVQQLDENKLDQAEESYYDGDLDKAISLVHQCLADSTINKDNRLRSYKILARIYLSKEDQEGAKDAVLKILQLDPQYLPNIEEEAPPYVNFVTDIKKEQNQLAAAKHVQAESGIRKWVWIGASSAAAAVLLVLVASASGGGDEDNTPSSLPGPPQLP
jgi:hypothetical protein